MDDDAGASSESPTLKQAPTKLEEAQTKLKEAQTELKEAQTKLEKAQTELKEAQTKLEKAQTAWLNAERDKDIHENMCRVPKKMCRVPKKMCRVPKKCVILGCTSKAPRLSLRKDFSRRNWTSSRTSSRTSSGKDWGRWLKMKRCWWRPSWTDTLWHRLHTTHQPHLMDTGISVHRSTTTHGVALFSKTFSQMTLKWSLGGYMKRVGIPSFQPSLSTLYPKMATTSSRMNNWVLKSTVLAIACCFFAI